MKKILPIIIVVLIIVGFGLWWQSSDKESLTENSATSADNLPGSVRDLPEPDAVAAVRMWVATELGISEELVIVESAYEREWPDTCLGLPAPELCAPGITSGYEVTVQAQGVERVYHTNEDGSSLRRKH